MGSTRNGLQTTTSPAAAIATRDAAPSATSAIDASALYSPAAGDSTFERFDADGARTMHAPKVARPLLRAQAGRHAVNETASVEVARSTTAGAFIDMTVKNLRIVGSAVLLLNFHEVRGFHFCSTSVAM